MEGFLGVGEETLFYREAGGGPPIVLLHGGPDFDHRYLAPACDVLAGSFRTVCYDQRGRGRSGACDPAKVTLESEVADVERVRRHVGAGAVAMLGHSFGALLALEYAIRHPGRLTHLILLNTAPVSREDYLLLREQRRRHDAEDVTTLATLARTAEFRAGELDAVASYYRVHFRSTLRDPDLLEWLVRSVTAGLTPEDVLRARAIEERLRSDTWRKDAYDLTPALRALAVPTLVVHGDHDFVPVTCAEHVAAAIPGARLVVLPDCGHFSYLDRPAEVRRLVESFVAGER